MNRIDLARPPIPKALFGYDRVRVDRLVQDLSDALARMTEEKVLLSARVKELEISLEAVKSRETVLQESLAAARGVGETIRAAAQKEAQLILETARLKADGMLQNANARLARIMEEAADAKKNKALFEMKLKAVIDDHLRLLTLNRRESESLEAATQKLHGTGPLPLSGNGEPRNPRNLDNPGKPDGA